MEQTAAQHIETLTTWNSRAHQAQIRIKNHAYIIARAKQVLSENRKLVHDSKALRNKLSAQTNSILDKIALARLIVKEMLNKN